MGKDQVARNLRWLNAWAAARNGILYVAPV